MESTIADQRIEAVNHGPRVEGKNLDILLLHYTGMESAEGALKWLCTEESGVSCHYFVFEDGRVVQLVDEARRAWHAGQSFWQGDTDINSRSIGIEIANPGDQPFAEKQIISVIELCRDCVTRLDILPQNVLAHSDVAPERKRDPGEYFPWRQLADAGVGLMVAASPITSGQFLQMGECGEAIAALQSMLAVFGYNVEISGTFDFQTQLCVKAFQLHYRAEQVDGIADQSTIKTLHALISATQLPA